MLTAGTFHNPGRGTRAWMAALFLSALVLLLCPAAFGSEVKLPDTTVSATRSQQDITKQARNVTVITADEIKAMHALNVVDLLRTVPGLNIIDYVGTGATASVDLRGFGEGAATRVLVLVDGRRVNSIDMSGADFSTIPVENIERIEVLHGPAGVLYGDNAVGGVINIITREGKGKPSFGVGGHYGNNQTYGGRAHAQGAVDKLGYFVTAAYNYTDGYRDRSRTWQENFTFNTRYYTSDTLSFLVDGGYNRADYQMPGSLSKAQMDADREQSTRPSDWGERDDGFIRGQFRKDWGSTGLLTCDLSYQGRKAASRWYNRRENDIKTLGFTPKYVWDSKPGGLDNRLTLGGDLYYSDSTLDQFDLDGPKLSGTDFDWLSMALYFLDEFSFARDFTLSAGARWQRGDFDITSRPEGAASSDKSYSDNQYAWTLGLAYRLAPASKVYVRVERTFRFPATDEYFTWGGFMELDPEKAMNYEAGLQYTFMVNGRLSLAAYWMEMKDEIAYNAATMKNENLQDTSHRGIEASLQVPLGAGNPSYAFATFAWEKAEFDAGPNDGNTIPLVPDYMASLGVSLAPAVLPGFRAIAQLNLVGERYMGQDFGNVAEKMSAYQTVDLRLSYQYKLATFYLNTLNVLGEEYESASFYSAWGSGYYPAPTQQVWGGVRLEF